MPVDTVAFDTVVTSFFWILLHFSTNQTLFVIYCNSLTHSNNVIQCNLASNCTLCYTNFVLKSLWSIESTWRLHACSSRNHVSNNLFKYKKN